LNPAIFTKTSARVVVGSGPGGGVGVPGLVVGAVFCVGVGIGLAVGGGGGGVDTLVGVGAAVGVLVGDGVGDGVKVPVGDAVGVAVGLKVGDGVALGLAVGGGVAAGLGLAATAVGVGVKMLSAGFCRASRDTPEFEPIGEVPAPLQLTRMLSPHSTAKIRAR
jgi:hypothetical protein